MNTSAIKPETVGRVWYIYDAKDQVFGRLAARIAHILRGKHKPEYTPNFDVGDYVIVINASHIKFTGGKESKKYYYKHSGYPGGLKMKRLDKMLEDSPDLLLRKAVEGMLPHGPLGSKMAKKLRVYAESEHDFKHYPLVEGK